MQHLPARIEDLPASLVDVAETLGLRVAVAMIEHFGGLEVRIPVYPGPEHPIIKALGDEDGYALCDLLRGQVVYIPNNRVASLRSQVGRLTARGNSIPEIARMLGLSQRHVRRLVNERPDPRQKSLFE